jgi:hypothetical protein
MKENLGNSDLAKVKEQFNKAGQYLYETLAEFETQFTEKDVDEELFRWKVIGIALEMFLSTEDETTKAKILDNISMGRDAKEISMKLRVSKKEIDEVLKAYRRATVIATQTE